MGAVFDTLTVLLIVALVKWCLAEEARYFPTISTPNCTIREPIYNHTFDLNGLRATLAHKVPTIGSRITGTTDFVELNVCGDPMTKRCDGKSAVTACFTTAAGKEQVIGVDFALKLRDGQLQFELNGGKCNSTADYATRVQLVCSYGPPLRRPIEVVAVSACDFSLVWYTELACMRPVKEATATEAVDAAGEACSVYDKKSGHTFDLAPLASRRDNFVHGRQNETFLLNVCKPVPYQYNGMCPMGSGACLKNDTASSLQEKFINIGTAARAPIYENGVLFMHLPSEVRCNATHNVSTHISFVCDSSTLIGQPEYLNRHNCEYNFDWRTSLACISTKPCATVDPHTGFTYDLSALANRQYNVSNTAGGLSYRFGVCNGAGAPCADGVGMCQINGTAVQAAVVPLGEFNANMRFNQTGGSPFLQYDGGSVCGRIDRHWAARVEFVCASGGMPEGPVLVEENEQCTVIVQFVTKLVCQQQIACKVHDWRTDVDYDLGALQSVTRNYVATVPGTDAALVEQVGHDTVFYLNVCRPLVPQYGLSCAGGSAACMATNGTNGMPTHERSLGNAVVGMTMVDTAHGGRRPQLKYYQGAQCAKDPSTEQTAVIEFYCDYAAQRGNPVLREVLDDCHYQFDWATNVICAEHAVEFRAERCELRSNDTGLVFDLKSISNNGKFTVKHDAGDFDVNVCNNGTSRNQVNYAEGSVKLFFQSPGPCAEKGKIDIELRIVCTATERHSSLSDDVACTLVLTAETPLICPFLGIPLDNKITSQSAIIAPAPTYSSAIGTTLVVLLVLGSVVALAAILLYRHPERRAQLGALIMRQNPVAVQYSRAGPY